MSVQPQELDFFGSANMPEADSVTVGGAVDFTKRIGFSDFTAASTVDVVSSSASDTATQIKYSGRDATGTQQTVTVTLNGQTVVTGSQSLSRLLYALSSGAGSTGPATAPSGTAAVGDIALLQTTRTISSHTCQAGSANPTGITPALMKLQSGDGASVTLGMIIRTKTGTGPNQLKRVIGLPAVYGTDIVAVSGTWGTVPDATTTYDIAPGMLFEKSNAAAQQTTCVVRPFATASADALGGSTRIYYEKMFAVNSDTTVSLTGATVVKQADPSGLYSAGGAVDFALCTSLNDTATATNRQTAPSGVGSYSSGAAPQSISPTGGALPNGTAPNTANSQGFWARLTLIPGMAPANSGVDWRINGNTT